MTIERVGAASSAANLGLVLAAVAAVTFGVGTTLASLAYDGGANPLTVVVVRTTAFVVIVGTCLIALRRDLRLRRSALLSTLWMAVTLAMVSFGYQGSVAYIPVGLAAITFYCFPLLVGVIAVAARRDHMTSRQTAALAAAFVGLALALGPGFEELDWRGIALALMASLGMALTLTFGGEATRGEDAIVMSFYTNVWMLVAFTTWAVFADGFSFPTTALGIAGLGGLCLSYVAAYLCWYLALSLVSPVRLSALLNAEPLVTLVVAWLALGEELSALQLLGAALVLASIAAVTLRPRASAPPPH